MKQDMIVILDLEIACGSKIALGNNDNVFLFQ